MTDFSRPSLKQNFYVLAAFDGLRSELEFEDGVLLCPFGWKAMERRHAQASGKGTGNGGFDESGRQKSQRDATIDFANAASFSVG